MEEEDQEMQKHLKEMMQLAVDLYVYQDKNSHEVITALKEKGVEEEQAKAIIKTIDDRVEETELSAHKKNVIIGGLFFAGGLVATFANFGFIFWGLIIFGGIQMVRGIMKM
jgi:homoaconitase/3-isopropylmalate dehydratase large subunit